MDNARAQARAHDILQDAERSTQAAHSKGGSGKMPLRLKLRIIKCSVGTRFKRNKQPSETNS